MKNLAYLLFFICSVGFSQSTSSNRPELAKTLLDTFVSMAEARGIEVRERLYTIGDIIFTEYGSNDHLHKNGQCKINIGLSKYEGEAEIMRALFHEIGHHMGLKHCPYCSYNIMAEFQDGKATSLFGTNAVRALYIDIYFEAIRNPKKYNEGHTHY